MVGALDKKMLRDLWRMKGQAAAIAIVIAMGVMLLVMTQGLVRSLEETRRAYYERYRLAEVFATVSRAPNQSLDDIAALPGVDFAEGRIVGSALIDIPGNPLPIRAQAISLPSDTGVALNTLYLAAGRPPSANAADEVLLLKSFAAAHGLSPGDLLTATINGVLRDYRIAGLAQSPEFLYTTAPGELVPDDARFGVIWMPRRTIAALFDMQGAFNQALVTLGRGANEQAVLDALDDRLARYGATGAIPLADQFSNKFVSQEIAGLRTSGAFVPPIFLGVAAFLLYVVITRMVQSEREEIGLLKAFGYSNAEVGAHYLKFVLTIASLGALLGCGLGIAAGRTMVGIYMLVFKFPFLVFSLEPSSFAIGLATSIAAASVGGLFVLRKVFALAPAEAMRPPAPTDYSRTGKLPPVLNRLLDQPSRMVLRRIRRQPGRMAGAVAGIAAGMGLSLAMITIYAGFDRTVDLSFNVIDRSDATVTFSYPLSDKALFEIARLPGIETVEPMRVAAAVFHNGVRSHQGAINAMPDTPTLYRALNTELTQIDIPPKGIVLSHVLAHTLKAQVGDVLWVDIREGSQPRLALRVSGISETLVGSPAYMRIDTLNALLGTPGQVSGAYLSFDAAHRDQIFAALKTSPNVAGVSLKSEALAAFVKMMNTGAGMIRYVMGTIAFIITFGIVYNAARIALSERLHDLAGLRVLGFTKGEAAFVLLGELGVVVLIALPLGALLGFNLSYLIATGFSTEFYQIPVVIHRASYGTAIAVVVGAALVSGLLVKRDLDRADLIAALKTRE
jgi:putative ABC transport system permease protein